jgi:hypothetical protein
MNNLPLLHCFDATARRYVPDRTFTDAVTFAQTIEALNPQYQPLDVAAAGIYQAPNGTIWSLECETYAAVHGLPWRCWYGTPGFVIDSTFGATPAAAIEAAKLKCY